jgi:excinuclease ABC subunit A
MLDYCRSHRRLTDPGTNTALNKNLPDLPADIINVIHSLLIHKLAAEAYDVSLSPIQRSEEHLRTIPQILQHLQDRNPAPIINSREPRGRLVGICRDFAVVFTSMLRNEGNLHKSGLVLHHISTHRE